MGKRMKSSKHINYWIVVAVGAAALLLDGRSVFSQLSETPQEDTWITNGTVRAITRTAETVYLGGDFTYVGPYTGCGVPLNKSTGKAARVFPKVNGDVVACVPDGEGGWYIGGNFTRVGNEIRNYIARIRSDLSLDPVWNPNAGYPVTTLVVSTDGTVYAGGHFFRIGGEQRLQVAALDAKTGRATGWNPDSDGVVTALAVSPDDKTVYVARRYGVAEAFDATDGSAKPWNPEPSGDIYALAVSDDGKTVYTGGVFGSIGGQGRSYLAALDAVTGEATAWLFGANGEVRVLVVSGPTLYVGGAFSSICGQNRNNVAALDTATQSATDWNPNANGRVHALALSGDTIYAGGVFTRIGGQTRQGVAALDVSTASATAWAPGTECFGVLTLADSGDNVYAGGSFPSIGGLRRNHIAALNAATGAATAWNAGANARVLSLTASRDGKTIYAGGEFTTAGGQTRAYIAGLDATTGNATAWNPWADDIVRAVAVSDSVVYAAGEFTTIGGKPRKRIGALDTAIGAATTWDPNPNATSGMTTRIYAVTSVSTTAYAGGMFWDIGGQQRDCVAALDATAGNATAWKIDLFDWGWSPQVYALAVSSQAVFAAGTFHDRTQSVDIAGFDVATGATMPWESIVHPGTIPSPGYVYALALSGTTLYAGGRFYQIGGQSRGRLAALDATTGMATSWDPGMIGDHLSTVFALFIADEGKTLYVGGDFTMIGTQDRTFFAQYGPGAGPELPNARAGQWFRYK
jgi:hypothetical protein